MSNDYYDVKRFVIVAPTRSGGTLLSHAIDSHHDLFCHRGEPMHKNDKFWRVAGTPFTSIDLALSMQGYKWAGCKITYSQLGRIGVDALQKLNVNAIIHLVRKNPIRRIVSEAVRLQDKKKGIRTHTREARAMQSVTLDPVQVVADIEDYLMATYQTRKQLDTVPIAKRLDLSYEKLSPYGNQTRLPDSMVRLLCDFFEVSYVQGMPVGVVKRNDYKLSELITNYTEVRHYIEEHASHYSDYIKEI